MSKKIITIKECKATKADCHYANDKNECFKYKDYFNTGCTVGNTCKAVRTPLNSRQQKILLDIKNGAKLHWSYGPFLKKKITCKECGNKNHEKTKNIKKEDYWFLYYGQYIFRKNNYDTLTSYPLTDKGKAACFNMTK